MLRLLCYLGLLMLFLTGCQSNEPKIGEDGFPEFSEEELRKMMKNNPQYQSQLAQSQGDAQLIQKMEELLTQSPNDLANNYNLAKLYHQKISKDSSAVFCQKAIALYSTVIKINPEYEKGHAFYNRMLCYFQNKEFDAALKDIDAFAKTNKGQTRVNYLSKRAEILFEKGEKDKACEDFRAAWKVFQKDSLPVENEEVWKERCS